MNGEVTQLTSADKSRDLYSKYKEIADDPSYQLEMSLRQDLLEATRRIDKESYPALQALKRTARIKNPLGIPLLPGAQRAMRAAGQADAAWRNDIAEESALYVEVAETSADNIKIYAEINENRKAATQLVQTHPEIYDEAAEIARAEGVSLNLPQ